MEFHTVEPSYISKDGCRLVWKGIDEDDTDVVILNKKELDDLVEILKSNGTGEVELEDQSSMIRINSDVTEFILTNHRLLEAKTTIIQEQVLAFVKVPHEPQYVYVGTKEFYPSVWIRDNKDLPKNNTYSQRKSSEQSLIQAILSSEPRNSNKTSLPLISLEYCLQDAQPENLTRPRLRIGKLTKFSQLLM